MVTIDAMGCQTAIAGQSRDQGGDYLLALQRNHKKASKAVKQYFHAHIEPHLAWRTSEHFFDAFDDSHGRTVRRRIWAITDLTALPELAQWPALQAVIGVETMRAAYPGAPIPSDSLPYTCFLLNGDMKLHRNWHLFI
jgi:predicted transposase YbfD/YdcC